MKQLCILFLMVLCFCGFTNKAMGQTWNISDNSTSGNNVSATLSGSTLTISGTGNMADFDVSVEGEAPWYSVRTNIQTVTIQNGVTNIGNRAFKDCSNLRTITALPVSVTKIGYQSFYNCTHSNFTAITIPATVNTIEGEAFLNCTNLKTVTLENGSGTLNFARYRIGTTGSNYRYGWFLGSPVQTLNLGRNYTYETTNPIIDIQATLQTLTIKITVTSIGVDAFSNCSLLKTVTFEDGSATLNFSKSAGVSTENYFANTPIETLYLGRNITYNTSYCVPFDGITTLKTVTMGNLVTSIGANLFQNCSGLNSVTFGTGVTSIGASAFAGCTGLKSINIGNNVISIGDNAFNGAGLTSINISNAVTSIGTSAFYACQSLPSITIPKYVTSIGVDAFSGCSLLKTVTFEDGSATLNFSKSAGVSTENYFANTPIETLYLGRNITYNTSYCVPFDGITTLKTVTMGNLVTSIGANLFQNCSGLNLVTFGTGVTSIGTSTFAGCTGLKSISIGNNVTTIGDNAFNGAGLTSVNISNSVTSIGESTFYACESLPSITIPKYVTSIGAGAFSGCSLLKTVTFEDGSATLAFPSYNTGADNYFANPEILYLGRNITYSSNDVPFDGITTLKTLTIGSQVTSIGQNLFNGCTGLTSITNNATTPQSINANVFTGVDKTACVLKVPAASLPKYQAATVWKDFYIQGVAGNCASVGNVLSNNASLGSAMVIEYVSNDVAKIAALPQANAVFVSWSDGNTQNPRTVSLCGTSFTANFAVCGSTAVSAIEASSVQIYPNPAKNELFIQSEQPIDKAEILDMSGRVVNSTNSTTVNVSHLPKGTYFVRVFVDGQSITKKIIKE